MHTLIGKFTSVLTTITLVGLNLMPTLVYSANNTPENKVEDNIVFDAKINNEDSLTANINEKLSLYINLAITNNGYIKDGKITIENNNYKIGSLPSSKNDGANNDLGEQSNNGQATNTTNQANGTTTQTQDTTNQSNGTTPQTQGTTAQAPGTTTQTQGTTTQAADTISQANGEIVQAQDTTTETTDQSPDTTEATDNQATDNQAQDTTGTNNQANGEIVQAQNTEELMELIDNGTLMQTDSNTIELNQISNEQNVQFSLPIEFEKNDVMDISYFERDSQVKLDVTFINEDGKEENISKTVNHHLKWDVDVAGNVNVELTRYLKYENKTLISFLVSSGVQENNLPLTDKAVRMLVPSINNMEPSKIIVSDNQNGYTYQDKFLVINKSYTDNDKVQWNSTDEYLVTYIYDTQTDTINIETMVAMLAKTVSGKDIEAHTDSLSYQPQQTIGNLVDASILGDSEINKGYMYTNLKRTENKLETTFTSSYKVNIGLVDFVDEIHINENPAESETITKKVTVNADEIVKIFGQEGNIRVLNNNNEEIGTLNKDNTQLDVNQYGLKFITTKPVQEGDINIYLDKCVNPNLEYTKESLSQTNQFNCTVDVMGIFQGQEISHAQLTKAMNLIEPESRATISINQENLSTAITNEDVVITATLERNDISDSLYTDPEILITLPNQVTNVTLKDAKLIYEEELVPVDFKMVDKQIYLKLQGTQTTYSDIPNADGTVVRIVADMELDKLSVNANEKVVLQYINQEKQELKAVETPISIVAPTGFITANMGTLSQTVTAINQDETVQISANSKAKRITISGTAISNLEENTSYLSILGRIPAQDTYAVDISSHNLNSTFTTNLVSAINVTGIDADIYYSDNGNATVDLDNATNGWSTEAKGTSKSYLIVSKSAVAPAQRIDFSYDITVPQNLAYENNAVSTYAVYYNSEAENNANKSIVLAKSINIATEYIPVITTTITAKDYYNEEEIKNGDNIHLGQYVRYTIHATNTGKKTAENVTVNVQRPDKTHFYIEEYLEEHDMYNNHFDYSEVLTKQLDIIEPQETKDIDVVVVYPTWMQKDVSTTVRAEVMAGNMLENSTASFENTTIEGTLELRLLSTGVNGGDISLNQELTYYVTLDNNNSNTINNVSAKINIPKYLEIINCDGGSFDEKSRVLTYNMETLDSYQNFKFTARATYSDEPNQAIEVTGTATFDGMEKEIKSNKYTHLVNDTKGFTATLSSNVNDKMLDTDTVEYYINVKNDSKKTAKISVTENLATELKIISYTVENGNNIYTKNDSIVVATAYEDVKPGDTLRLTIVTKPYLLDTVGQQKEIENGATVKVNNMDLPIQTLKQQIEGTKNFNTASITDKKEEQEDIYSISGRIWHDANFNSKQDEGETGLSNIPLTLYNVKTKTAIQDVNEEEGIKLNTDEQGNYHFSNLVKGQYVIIADYDNSTYELADYQLSGLSQNEDSDFISSSDKATTNVLTIDGGNVYNIDLGLSNIKSFNPVLKNSISRISVINKHEAKSYDFNVEKADLRLDKDSNSSLVIEYAIEIVNEGNIEGYVTKIENYITQGMQFISELNSDWYVDSNGNAVNKSLANTVMKPQETQTLKLVLVKNTNASDTELIHNTAEVTETYNKYGITSTITNLKERKAKSADVIVADNSGIVALQTTAISLGIIALMTLAGYGIYKFMER